MSQELNLEHAKVPLACFIGHGVFMCRALSFHLSSCGELSSYSSEGVCCSQSSCIEIGLSDSEGNLSSREENMIDPLPVYQVRNISGEQEQLHISFP